MRGYYQDTNLRAQDTVRQAAHYKQKRDLQAAAKSHREHGMPDKSSTDEHRDGSKREHG